MMKTRSVPLVSILILFVITSCVMGQLTGPVNTPPPSGIKDFVPPFWTRTSPEARTTPFASVTPIPTFTPFQLPTETALPTIFLTMFVNEYESFTAYRQRALWQAAIGGARPSVEDFETDITDFGKLPDPYLTGRGFLFKGADCPGLILTGKSLLPTGASLHFRSFGDGCTFVFPNKTAVSAFGFDYRAAEDWILRINETAVPLPGGRAAFVGVALHTALPSEFTLSSNVRAQGGLSIDNIAYIPAQIP